MRRCPYCQRRFRRHRPWCKVVNPIGWKRHIFEDRYAEALRLLPEHNAMIERRKEYYRSKGMTHAPWGEPL